MAVRRASQAEQLVPRRAPRQIRCPRRGTGGRDVRCARRSGPIAVNAARSRGTSVRRLCLLLVTAMCWTACVEAHEVRPAFLDVRESSADTFEILWKVPARGEYRLSLHARLPQ